MEREDKIIESIENHVDEIRKYCNGLDSKIELLGKADFSFKLNFNELNFKIIQELKKYFRISRNDKGNLTLSKLIDILKDMIYEFENKTLIEESLFRNRISENKGFVLERYSLCDDIYNAVIDLFDSIEIEIELRENLKESSGRIDKRIDSSHCIDINTRFTIALFEEILKNPKAIKDLSNSKKAKILEKLTGHKRKTFANNYSKYGAGSNQNYIDKAKKLIESVLE